MIGSFFAAASAGLSWRCWESPWPLAAEEQTIVLRDYLRQNWTNELVTYPFVAKEGTCREGSAMLTGPRGPVAVQLSDVECWPGTACVKSARLSFIADLHPWPRTATRCATDLAGADASTNVEDRSERDAGPGTGGDHDPPVRRASRSGAELRRAGGGRKRSRSRRGDAPGRRHVVSAEAGCLGRANFAVGRRQ